MAPVTNFLTRILARKREELRERKRRINLADLKKKASDSDPPRGFYQALITTIEEGKPAVIAEIKKASPSRGVLCSDFDPALIAASYADAGATCLSILTDKHFFQGDDQHLVLAKASCQLPVLRKDFMIDPYHIYESKVIGADCILLIVAALTDDQLRELAAIATELNMDTLVEVHNREELERGLMLRTPLIGINNRNLHTFITDLNTTIDMLIDVYPDRTVVTESGIQSKADVSMMRKHGVSAFLVGKALMAANHPGKKLKELFE